MSGRTWRTRRRCTRAACLLSHFCVTRLWSQFERQPFSYACRFNFRRWTKRVWDRRGENFATRRGCFLCALNLTFGRARQRVRASTTGQARQNRDSLLLIFTLGRIDSFEHWSACAMEKWIPYEANHSRTCTSEKQKAGRYWRKTFLFLLFRCVMNNARDAQIARNASCASLTATAESKRIESVTVSRAEQPRERETGMDRERERERGERSAYNRLR